MDTKLKDLLLKANFEQIFQKLGYAYFTNGKYNLNIIGVRNLLNGDKQDNTFNDAIICIYKDSINKFISSLFIYFYILNFNYFYKLIINLIIHKIKKLKHIFTNTFELWQHINFKQFKIQIDFYFGSSVSSTFLKYLL